MNSSGKALRVGDRVTTDFSGQVTHHEITAISTLQVCESGIAFKVTPPVPKSSGSYAWMDSGWFKEIK